jgi:hypothetical protein
MSRWWWGGVAFSLSLGACAIHPVPEDVTGVTTAGIVKQIRCETRDAARAAIRRFLEKLANEGNLTAQNLLSQFQENPESMINFNAQRSFPAEGDRYIRAVFDVIYSAAVAYNFDLTMTEDNNLTTGINFLGPWQNTFTLGITGDANRARQNERTFTITDNFKFLLVNLNMPDLKDQRYCDGHIALGPNYVYPIVGQIGIWNTVQTFFQLSLFDDLEVKKDKPSTPALADKLTFTTTVDLIATPKVVFAPFKTGFRVADATLTGTAKRTDSHQVLVGLALDSTAIATLASLRGFVFSTERSTGVSGPRQAVGRKPGGDQVPVLHSVVASPTSSAEVIALIIIDQLKSRELQLRPPPP